MDVNHKPYCVMALSLALFACSPEAAQPPTLESTVQMTPNPSPETTPAAGIYVMTAEDNAVAVQETLTLITGMVDVLTEKKTPEQLTAPEVAFENRTPEQYRTIKAAVLGEGEFYYPKDPLKPVVSFIFSKSSLPASKPLKGIEVDFTGSFERRDGNSPFTVADTWIDINSPFEYTVGLGIQADPDLFPLAWEETISNSGLGIKVDASFYTKSLGLKFVRRFHESELTEFEQRARYAKNSSEESASKMSAADLRAYYAQQPAYYTFEKPSERGVLLFEFAVKSDESKYPERIGDLKIIHKIKPTPIGTKCETNEFCPQSGVWEISWSKEALEQKDFILPNERREFKRGDTFPVPTVQVRQHTFLSRLDVFGLYFFPKWVAYPGRSANWKLVSYL